MEQKAFLKLTPQKTLNMTFALQNALKLLQMNNQELSEHLQSEAEKNPLIEIYERKKPQNYFEKEIISTPTLYEHLIAQIRENFSSPLEKLIAIELLEHLDEKGFLTCQITPASEQVLKILQTFDPPGIFARTTQEAILLQLNKASSLYKIVECCFDDLLHARFTAIKKKLKLSEINVNDLHKVNLRPSSTFAKEISHVIIPDVRIEKTPSGWKFDLLEEEIPQIVIQDKYCDLSPINKDEKEQLKTFKTDAMNLCRSLSRRKELLKKITKKLICKQASYLNNEGQLQPFSPMDLAEELQIHESTISRALCNKYAITPRGIIPLKSLLSSRPASQSAIEVLSQAIKKENKLKPLTDIELAKILQDKGFKVARRTISKYRKELKIASTLKRRHHQ